MRPDRQSHSHSGPSDYPDRLPLLPLFDHVLLPGGFVRVTVPAAWRKSNALVQHLLQQQGGDVYVAAVPYMTGGASGGVSSSRRGATADEEEAPADDALDWSRLHHIGTAARVLQMVRRTEAGGWTVTLEGRCRLRVGDVLLSLQPQELYMAAVQQLDYFGGSSSSKAASSPGSSRRGSLDDVSSGRELRLVVPSQDSTLTSGSGSSRGSGEEEISQLMQRLLAGTRRLLALVQGASGGRGAGAGARVARTLQQQGPARAADVVGALVARDPVDRLAVLSTVGVSERLRLVLALQQRLLDMAEQSVGGNAARRSGGSSIGAASGRRVRLPANVQGFAGEGSRGDSEGEEDEDAEGEEDGRAELAALMARLRASSPPPEVLRAGQREFRRLRRGSDQHPGHAMALAYLETLASLPWSRTSRQLQLEHAQQQQREAEGEGVGTSTAAAAKGTAGEPSLAAVRAALDEAHYGLEKIKERIVQYVAVQRLRGWDARAPILCFIGPPGVGKTTLARSVGEVLGRPFQRISLGGVRDEAEIRGHRRTYIGAMPGRVLQALRRAGVRDPVLLLDEVDKMGRDARGDPAAALLEVLDPEQNHAFVDTYLGLPFDLSGCVFVATANRAADIPAPLLDRMEVVTLGGYTQPEKEHIAERHLLPRLLAEHGLLGPAGQPLLEFPRDMVKLVIEGYTREAGVRSLSRCLAAVCRHVAVQIVSRQEGQRAQQRTAEAASEQPEQQISQQDDVMLASGTGLRAAGQAGRRLVLRAPSGAAAAAASSALAGRGGGSWQAHGLQLSSRSSGGGQQLSQAALGAASAYGGYPWQRLPEQQQQPAQPQQQQQGGWLSWLRRSRQEESEGRQLGQDPEQAPQQQQHGHVEDWAGSWHMEGSMGLVQAPPMQAADAAAAAAGEDAAEHLWPEPQQPHGITPQQQQGELPLLPSQGEAGTVVAVDEALIEQVLGPRRFEGHDRSERATTPGAAAGLVWTAAGGQVQYIECVCVGGRSPDSSGASEAGQPAGGRALGVLTLTGQLGDVLEESARIALSWVRAHARALGLPGGAACPSRCWDVHVHLPSGAVPKDGPSAGVTLAVALVSLFTGRCVRPDVAMTGELTLRGLVLPVGGVKEKLLAAAAAGMARVLVPARNMRDVVADVPADVKAVLEILPCQRVEEALAAAFDPPLQLESAGPTARL